MLHVRLKDKPPLGSSCVQKLSFIFRLFFSFLQAALWPLFLLSRSALGQWTTLLITGKRFWLQASEAVSRMATLIMSLLPCTMTCYFGFCSCIFETWETVLRKTLFWVENTGSTCCTATNRISTGYTAIVLLCVFSSSSYNKPILNGKGII